MGCPQAQNHRHEAGPRLNRVSLVTLYFYLPPSSFLLVYSHYLFVSLTYQPSRLNITHTTELYMIQTIGKRQYICPVGLTSRPCSLVLLVFTCENLASSPIMVESSFQCRQLIMCLFSSLEISDFLIQLIWKSLVRLAHSGRHCRNTVSDRVCG